MAGERKPYLADGHYVEMPIVLQVLLSPVELLVFNTLIHLTDLQHKFISRSLIAAYTGRDNKSITKAVRFLLKLKIIEKGKTCQLGTHYEINNPLLTQIVRTMNKEHNPIQRMRMADTIRGSANAIHAVTIRNLTETSIDSRK